jgi:hypothetical protein
MQADLSAKLKAILWDLPEKRRSEIVDDILCRPVEVFRSDEQIFLKILNSLQWYELSRLVGKQNLLLLLTDSTIQKLFPVQRRNFYLNVRRLLSKYALPTSG